MLRLVQILRVKGSAHIIAIFVFQEYRCSPAAGSPRCQGRIFSKVVVKRQLKRRLRSPQAAASALLGCCNAPAGTAIARGLDTHYIVKTGRFAKGISPPPTRSDQNLKILINLAYLSL